MEGIALTAKRVGVRAASSLRLIYVVQSEVYLSEAKYIFELSRRKKYLLPNMNDIERLITRIEKNIFFSKSFF